MLISGILFQSLAFLWIAVPYLQKELDSWAYQQNMTPRRAQKSKILPQEAPELVFNRPDTAQSGNFKVRYSA